MKAGLRRFLVLVALAAIGALVARAVTTVPPLWQLLEPIELTTLDWRVRTSAPAKASESPIVLVLFDSASVASWPYLVPFPRALLASVIDIVAAKDPKAIALDVYLDRRYPQLETLDHGDARLRAALEEGGNVVIPARTVRTGDRRSFLPPDPYFSSAAAATAAADLPTPHEVIRDAVLLVQTTSRVVPGVPLALYALGRGLDPDSLGNAFLRSGELELPALPPRLRRLEAGRMVATAPLRFLGPPSRPGREDGAFPAYSASTLLALGDNVPEAWFRDRTVLVGTGFHPEERFRSPFYAASDSAGGIYGWTYGTEVHATALQNLLSGGHPWALAAWKELLLLFLLVLLPGAATLGRGAAWGVATGLGCLGAVLATAWYVFDGWSLQLPIVSPTLALAITVLGSTAYLSASEGKQKRLIRRAFSRYVAPGVVAELLADPSRMKLGGERRDVTLLFNDIVGFTALAEKLDPERLLTVLSRYLDEMTRLVILEDGTLDKYMGDALMALYGAPSLRADHALRACRTAIRMQRRLAELNEEWRSEDWPAFRARIGVHTGRPVVGNIGGEHRFDYTALGDAVNLASRLQAACKVYDVGIIVSERTVEAAGPGLRVRELDMFAAYGRTEPLRIFELVGLEDDESPLLGPPLQSYDDGLAAYRERDYARATALFRAVLAVAPGDGPATFHLRRCERLTSSPSTEAWEAATRQVSK